MKAFVGAAIAVAGLVFAASSADATPSETITWGGTLGYGTDGNHLEGRVTPPSATIHTPLR